MMRWMAGTSLGAVVLSILIGLSVRPEGSSGSRAEGMLDVFFAAADTFVPGSEASLRIELRRSRGLRDSTPVAGGAVVLEIAGESTETIAVFEGRTGKDGVVDARFRVPDLAPGAYTLRVSAKDAAGQETLERKVRLERGAKILLVSDKPLYQPGQVIHLRALALQTHDLVPIAEEEIIFEIEDGKGNKVFKRRGRTDGFGVAVADFTLADEVNMGPYQIRALLGEGTEAKKTVTVKKYVLPRFKSVVTTDKAFYLPKEIIEGELQVDYLFGKPVAGGKVTIKAATFDVAFKDFQEVIVETDANGHASFEIQLPDYFVGQPLDQGNALVKLEIAVEDRAEHIEKVTKTWPVVARPLQVGIMPESGRLVPGVENRVFVVAGYPDGSPAEAEVIVRFGSGEKAREIRLDTDSGGIGSFSFIPDTAVMTQGGWVQPRPGLGRRRGGQQWIQEPILAVTLEARDRKGNEATLSRQLQSDYGRDAILLRTDKSIYTAGETMILTGLAPFPSGSLYLDVIKGGQIVQTATAEIKKGQAHHELPLTPDLFGSLEIHAYKLLASGEFARDTRVVYVHPPKALQIDVDLDQETYRPGQAARIDFRVTDAEGNPLRAALGVVIVDESVYALQDMQPGLEKVYFTLEKELQQPQVEIHSAGSLSDLVLARKLEERQQRAAEVLLAAAEPGAKYGLISNPRAERSAQLTQNIQALSWALYALMSSGEPFAHEDPETGAWAWDDDVLTKLVTKGHIQKEQLVDPWGHRLVAADLPALDPAFEVAAWVKGREGMIRSQVFQYMVNQALDIDLLRFDSEDGSYSWRPDALERLRKPWGVTEAFLTDLGGQPYTLDRLAQGHEAFAPENVARLVDTQRKRRIFDCLLQQVRSGRLAEIVVWSAARDRWLYHHDALERLVDQGAVTAGCLHDAKGDRFTLAGLEKEWPGFAPDNLAHVGFYQNFQQVAAAVHNWGNRNPKKVRSDDTGAWILPRDVLRRLGPSDGLQPATLLDPWGRKMSLVRLEEPPGRLLYSHQMRNYVMLSAGPDGRFDTEDDLRSDRIDTRYMSYPWPGDITWCQEADFARLGRVTEGIWALDEDRAFKNELEGGGRRFREQAQKAGAPMPAAEPADSMRRDGPTSGAARPTVRVREYFPETLLWRPALITDAEGRAWIDLEMADSITTWRLSASASSVGGGLGSISAPIRVFQDFFVDIDFPVSLTRNDEVSVPVAVYNYLDRAQKVELVVPEVEGESWFELLDEATKVVTMEAGEVGVVHFRIRARKIGHHKLTVMAYGSELNDAVRREVEIVPDGKRFEDVRNGRLETELTFDLDIPKSAIDAASKILRQALSRSVQPDDGWTRGDARPARGMNGADVVDGVSEPSRRRLPEIGPAGRPRNHDEGGALPERRIPEDPDLPEPGRRLRLVGRRREPGRLGHRLRCPGTARHVQGHGGRSRGHRAGAAVADRPAERRRRVAHPRPHPRRGHREHG